MSKLKDKLFQEFIFKASGYEFINRLDSNDIDCIESINIHIDHSELSVTLIQDGRENVLKLKRFRKDELIDIKIQ